MFSVSTSTSGVMSSTFRAMSALAQSMVSEMHGFFLRSTPRTRRTASTTCPASLSVIPGILMVTMRSSRSRSGYSM